LFFAALRTPAALPLPWGDAVCVIFPLRSGATCRMCRASHIRRVTSEVASDKRIEEPSVPRRVQHLEWLRTAGVVLEWSGRRHVKEIRAQPKGVVRAGARDERMLAVAGYSPRLDSRAIYQRLAKIPSEECSNYTLQQLPRAMRVDLTMKFRERMRPVRLRGTAAC
jgi:hypothetical protein